MKNHYKIVLVLFAINFVCQKYVVFQKTDFYTPCKLCLWWVYYYHIVRACLRPYVRTCVFVSVRNVQLLPQLLMEQYETLPIQFRHIEHKHEGVWFRKNNFLKNDSFENIENFFLIGLLYMH